MPGTKLLYLSRADVEAANVTMAEIVDAAELAFREKGHGRTEMPAKLGVHPAADDFLHAMPALVPAVPAMGLKWIAAYPGNPAKGLPQVAGLIVLNDVQTGMPLVVMDATWITAMRTGAATAIAARVMARGDASRVGILGCGVQGRTNLAALVEVLPITHATCYDVSPDVAARFAEETSRRLSISIEIAGEPRAAVSGQDVVVTAGPILKEPHGTIQPGWIDEGCFVSAVDYDTYFSRDALDEIDKFCTDDREQLAVAQANGYFRDVPTVYAEVGEMVAGRRTGRESATERTMTANLGLALHDVVVGSLVLERAQELGLATQLEL